MGDFPNWGPRHGPPNPQRSSRPGVPVALLDARQKIWSGKRDSNPRPPAWKAGALPLSYSRPRKWWGGEDLNPRRRTPADLQSAPFGHLGTSPTLPARDENSSRFRKLAWGRPSRCQWRWREDLNPRPTAYKAVALPLSYASTDKTSLYCLKSPKSRTLGAISAAARCRATS